ncbi:uncharacterized protein LOC143887930 [Tasmannia lanceolata]|uniref:uncharacterized protein LOC143887930 n=1 Tax=Tasmannia lanceolata TaxID=3420 RepID=UPI0040636466
MNSDMDNWPELPNDLLAVVFDHLPLSIHRIRFGAVCSSWYQFTMENCHWLDFHYQLPFMLVYDKERTETRNFYNITENKFYDIQLPEFRGKWCCGSSEGWVVTVDESTNIHLLDPFTSTQIQLPSLDKFPDPQFISWPELPWDYTYIRKALLSANPLSTPDYVVVTIVSSMLKLSFYKPGDEKWTTLENQWGPYEDVIYYKDKFYAITSNDAVVTCEFASNDFPKFTVFTPPSGELCDKRYLVESCGKLLKVSSRLEWNPGYDYDENRNLIQPIPEWPYKTVWFDIFELDEDTGKWIKTENLGDQTLFLGYNSSFSLSARDFPYCKGNSIYFTDSNDDAPDCNYDNGIYNLEDKSFKRINFFHRITKPLWVPRYLASNPINSKKIQMNSDMGKWSELPNDLLAMALDHLPIIDHIRFGAVCLSWNQFTMENCHLLDLHDQLPFMMLLDKERTETHNFYSISKNKFFAIQLPAFHGKWCCGSSKGWVVTVDDSSNVHLLNPLTSTQIPLPSLDKFPDDQNSYGPEESRYHRTQVRSQLTCPKKPRDHRYIVKTHLLANSILSLDYVIVTIVTNQLKLSFRYICKAILSADPISTPDYVVVAIVTNLLKLSFYKPGDEKWTTLNNQWGPYEDVIYYKDKFYGITTNNTVVSCEFASNDFPKFTVVIPPSRVRKTCAKMNLVESCGKLLKILRCCQWYPDYDYDENGNEIHPFPELAYRTVWFDVFELEEDTGKWIQTESIGDQILFLGCNSSFSLSGLDFPQWKGNCIYFTDSNDVALDWKNDNGVFGLENMMRSINTFTKPLWVSPYFSK